MTESLTRHVIVPIANESDAVTTCEELESIVDDVVTLTVVHVLERTDGYLDKAPFGARQAAADRIFEIVEARFEGGPEVRRELRYGTDVVEEIVATAEAVDATAIVFVHSPDGLRRRLLRTADSYRLVTESDRPVVIFSRVESSDSNES